MILATTMTFVPLCTASVTAHDGDVSWLATSCLLHFATLPAVLICRM